MAINQEELMETIENMTVLELSEPVRCLRQRSKSSATAVAAAPVAGTAGDGAAAAARRSRPSSTSRSRRPEIEGSIKVVRAATGLWLKEAKALVDEAPNPVKRGCQQGGRRSPAEPAPGGRLATP